MLDNTIVAVVVSVVTRSCWVGWKGRRGDPSNAYFTQSLCRDPIAKEWRFECDGNH